MSISSCPQHNLALLCTPSDCLQSDEIITCADACSEFVVVGTSSGSIVVYECDGGFVLQRRALLPLSIRALKISGFLVVCGGDGGFIVVYDWKEDQVFEYGGPGRKKDAVCFVEVSPDFSLSSGALYYATEGGSVVKRTSGKIFGYNDTVLFSEVINTTGKFIQTCAVGCLKVASPLVIFSWYDSVYMYDEEVGMIVGEISRPKKPTDVPHFFDVPNGTTHISLPFNREMSVLLDGSRLIIHWGSILYFCERHHDGTLSITRHYEMPDRIFSTFMVGEYLVLVLAQGDHLVGPYVVAMFEWRNMRLKDRFVLGRELSGNLQCVATVSTSSPDFDFHINEGSHVGGKHTYFAFEKELWVLRPMKLGEQVVWLVDNKRFEQALYTCKRDTRQNERIEIANEYACFLWEDLQQHEKAVACWAEHVLPFATAEYWNEFTSRLDKAGKLFLIEKFCPVNNTSLLSPEMFFRILERRLESGEYKIMYDLIMLWPLCYSWEKLIDRIRSEIERWENMGNNPARNAKFSALETPGQLSFTSSPVSLVLPYTDLTAPDTPKLVSSPRAPRHLSASAGYPDVVGGFMDSVVTVPSPIVTKPKFNSKTAIAMASSNEESVRAAIAMMRSSTTRTASSNPALRESENKIELQSPLTWNRPDQDETRELDTVLPKLGSNQIQYLYLSLFKLHEFGNQTASALQILLLMNAHTAVDYFSANLHSSLCSYFRLAKLSETDVLQRRDTLLQLLYLDSDTVLRVLADHQDDISPEEVNILLSNHPFYLTQYEQELSKSNA